VLDFDAQAAVLSGRDWGKAEEWFRAEPSPSLCDERLGSRLFGSGHEALQVGRGEAVVVGKGDAGGDALARGF